MKRLLGLLCLCLILAGCGSKMEPFSDDQVLVRAGAYTLSDGTVVDLWQTEIFETAIYQTADGVELLRFRAPVDIANVHTGIYDDFVTLDETVQREIRAFYDANWPGLDIQGLLENAWRDYHASDREGEFSAHYAEQSIFPCAANDSFVAYCVESVIPIESSLVSNVYFDTIFDRKTGEVIDFWDLFSVSREQAAEVMARKLAQNNSQYPEIKAALEGEAVIRTLQGGFEILFPLGTLSWSEYDHYMDLDCTELEDILYDWAITEKYE